MDALASSFLIRQPARSHSCQDHMHPCRRVKAMLLLAKLRPASTEFTLSHSLTLPFLRLSSALMGVMPLLLGKIIRYLSKSSHKSMPKHVNACGCENDGANTEEGESHAMLIASREDSCRTRR